MIKIKMNNFFLNLINFILKYNVKGNDYIVIVFDYFVKLFLKRKFWKKVYYYVSKVVFSFSLFIFNLFINIL